MPRSIVFFWKRDAVIIAGKCAIFLFNEFTKALIGKYVPCIGDERKWKYRNKTKHSDSNKGSNKVNLRAHFPHLTRRIGPRLRLRDLVLLVWKVSFIFLVRDAPERLGCVRFNL